MQNNQGGGLLAAVAPAAYISSALGKLERLVRRMREVVSNDNSLVDITDPDALESVAREIVQEVEARLAEQSFSARLVEAWGEPGAARRAAIADNVGDTRCALEDFKRKGAVHFFVTPQHLAAIARLSLGSTEHTSYPIYLPCSNFTRPWGDRAIFSNLAEFMGITRHPDQDWSVTQEAMMIQFSREVVEALQVCTRSLSFEPGLYVASAVFCDYWVRAGEVPEVGQ